MPAYFDEAPTAIWLRRFLARPPGLHLGEIPPWRTDMDKDQKKRVAVFRFGVVSDFLARDCMGLSERERLLRGKCVQRW
ncbi:hypothetical protein DFAR_530022 [Desulfarculales bacterium]